MAISISNLRYADASQATINMDVSGVFPEVIQFTYIPGDPAPVSKAVSEILSSGSYEIAPYQGGV